MRFDIRCARFLAAVTALLSVSGTFAAQSPSVAFEVASVKVSKPDAKPDGIVTRRGSLSVYNETLKRCIMSAYSVGPNQVIDGPDWLDSARFEIIAKAQEPVGYPTLLIMLQNLLTERFKLVLRSEVRPIDAYVLENTDKAAKLTPGDGREATTTNGRGNIVATNASMDRFAEILSRQMDRPVVNRTGLEGVFNITVTFNPDSIGVLQDNVTDVRPSIFTAIQEQLGLKLHAEKAPVKVFVVDRAEKPDAN